MNKIDSVVRKDPLLERLNGSWILQGTIAGHETTHDIESDWVLSDEYLRLHETSREKNAQGQSAHEAIVFIEWDESSNEYRCLWLDSTGGGGLSAPIAKANGAMTKSRSCSGAKIRTAASTQRSSTAKAPTLGAGLSITNTPAS